MDDLLGTKVIFAVAQLPFEHGSEVRHQFGTLAPLVYEDGSVAEDSDFPNNGLAWWMIVSQSRRLALPGLLVKGTLETAREFLSDDSTSSYFQVNRESVAPLDISDGVEVLHVPAESVRDVRHL